MIGFVYILKDNNSKYYIGSCRDVGARYKNHVLGRVYTTHRMENPKVVFSQKYATIGDAIKIEKKLKRLKRKDYIEKIIKDGYIKMKS